VRLDVPDVLVGHWTDRAARTGCTVVLFPEGTVASGEVRGGAPATREFELLSPGRLVERLDAVVLSGGSAFGLAAGDGVARWCEGQGRGFPTGAGPVPIVVGMSLFDLLVGDGSVRPGPHEGEAACHHAVRCDDALVSGPVGAGTGATVGKWRGRECARPGGIGVATASAGPLVVTAVLAVNAFGDVDDGVVRDWPRPEADRETAEAFGNTTIGVVITNATLAKDACLVVAQGGHDGLARALVPAHARVDGDALVAAATGTVAAPVDHVRLLATRAVEAAVRAAVAAGGAR
jgi:L-aminopeptidase/D-esterase-like protein